MKKKPSREIGRAFLLGNVDVLSRAIALMDVCGRMKKFIAESAELLGDSLIIFLIPFAVIFVWALFSLPWIACAIVVYLKFLK